VVKLLPLLALVPALILATAKYPQAMIDLAKLVLVWAIIPLLLVSMVLALFRRTTKPVERPSPDNGNTQDASRSPDSSNSADVPETAAPTVDVIVRPSPGVAIYETRMVDPVPDHSAPMFHCHFCWEPVEKMKIDFPGEFRLCSVCRHIIRDDFLEVPCHKLDRRQQVEILLSEGAYILIWEHGLLQGFKQLVGYHDSEYRDEEVRVGRLEKALDFLHDRREEIIERIERNEDPETIIFEILDAYPEDDGGLFKNLARTRQWRESVTKFSRDGVSVKVHLEFQIDLVKNTSWGAFSGSEQKTSIIKELDRRLQEEFLGFLPRWARQLPEYMRPTTMQTERLENIRKSIGISHDEFFTHIEGHRETSKKMQMDLYQQYKDENPEWPEGDILAVVFLTCLPARGSHDPLHGSSLFGLDPQDESIEWRVGEVIERYGNIEALAEAIADEAQPTASPLAPEFEGVAMEITQILAEREVKAS